MRMAMQRRRAKRPTLKLLEIDGLDVSLGEIMYVGEKGVGIRPCFCWEPRVGEQVLEVWIGPRLAC